MSLWLHPSVTSTVIDNSGYTATATATTVLFAPGFFEKGQDNKLMEVYGPTDQDFIAKLGAVDAVEYGQNHLNIVNWLTAGGTVLTMRCLPPDAKYSHAILEVLTRKVTVKGSTFTDEDSGSTYELVRDYDADGNFIGLVYFDENNERVPVCSAQDADKVTGDVALEEGESIDDILLVSGTIQNGVDRTALNVVPKITYVPSGVSKTETIEAYIRGKQGQVNSEGYTRHIIGYFIPEGRGAKYYNDCRIQIQLETHYDNTFDFRVYSVTLEKFDSVNEEWGLLYGPYYVSFSETARDKSNETMFISDVFKRYCREFDFVTYGEGSDEESGEYNLGYYSAAKAILGAESREGVPLGRVDILSCQEFYNEETNTYSNVHRNCLLAGGSFNLRKDIIYNTNVLYSDRNLPMVNPSEDNKATIIVANTLQRTVTEVDMTSNKITVADPFDVLAYTEDDIASMESEEEQEYARTVAVVAEDNPIVYVNDIAEPKAIATVKTVDDAIERITGKKYKLYLNKNGADFYIDQQVTITMKPLVIYNEGDDPATKPTCTATVVTGDTFTGVINVGDEFTLGGENPNVFSNAAGTAYFEKKTREDSGTVTYWSLMAKVDTDFTEIATADVTAETVSPADGTWDGLTLSYDKNEETISISYNQDTTFVALVSEIDDANDAIVIDFTNATNSEEIQKLIKNFQDYDFGDPEDPTFDGAAGGDDLNNLITIEGVASAKSDYASHLSLSEGDYAYFKFGSAGSVDTANGATKAQVATTRKNLLIQAAKGSLDQGVRLKKFYPFDIILDANYDTAVKDAFNELAVTRQDCMFICDVGFTATPEQALEKRTGSLTYNNFYTAIFTQDMRVYDSYTSKNLKVTPTYFLATKIPQVDLAYGIHYAFVGPNRGEIEGMVENSLSWNPIPEMKEKLYKKQLNYIQHDVNHLMFMGQLTSQKKATSMSDIPNVRAFLRIRRDMEALMENYTFERINDTLLTTMQNAGSKYMEKWVNNSTLSEASVSVTADEYDRKQKLARVAVDMSFTSFLERVIITFTIK